METVESARLRTGPGPPTRLSIPWSSWTQATPGLESGLSPNAPEGTIEFGSQSHHFVRTVHLAKVNNNKGFTIFKTIGNVA